MRKGNKEQIIKKRKTKYFKKTWEKSKRNKKIDVIEFLKTLRGKD